MNFYFVVCWVLLYFCRNPWTLFWGTAKLHESNLILLCLAFMNFVMEVLSGGHSSAPHAPLPHFTFFTFGVNTHCSHSFVSTCPDPADRLNKYPFAPQPWVVSLCARGHNYLADYKGSLCAQRSSSLCAAHVSGTLTWNSSCRGLPALSGRPSQPRVSVRLCLGFLSLCHAPKL